MNVKSYYRADMIPEIEGLIDELKEYMNEVIAGSRGHYKKRVLIMLGFLTKIEKLAMELRR